MIFLAKYTLLMVDAALSLYLWIVLIYIIAGWFVQNRHVSWYVFLAELSEPTLSRIRRLTRNRLVIESFDLSPLVLVVLVYIIRNLIRRIVI